ncbi:MAG TPA: class I SAM-dependent methyltransferase [Limnobacter sp.]|uniref:class I SAM-dependent methyltransferase n=1 Tax=Limnobacter sp. TaxID=2003368 RepID=UPI002E2F4FD5|nr:class I SAM-dependent methyltransferase [Limnobacter sp.]HEX5485142.1 class I SAM-dependent methyltransferase [Limnobacter sp.]
MANGWLATQYEKHVLPTLLDFACGMKPLRMQREKVVPKAHGKVLEIGIGTGLNMRFYDSKKVKSVLGLDPAMQMHRLARRRIQQAGLDVQLLGLSASSIPLDDHSIDTIVMTYTLCSIEDPVPALREMRRVLKPEGKLLFCEHGIAPDAKVASLQNRLQPVWGKLAGGCHLNRDIPALLNEAGFKTEQLEASYVPGPKVFTFNYWGQAYSEQ